jgi:hypothetical protein
MSKPSMVCAREMGAHRINGGNELMSDTSAERVRSFPTSDRREEWPTISLTNDRHKKADITVGLFVLVC